MPLPGVLPPPLGRSLQSPQGHQRSQPPSERPSPADSRSLGEGCFVCLDHSCLGSLWRFEMSAALKLAVCSEWQGFLCWGEVISGRSLSLGVRPPELEMGRVRVLLWLPGLSAASRCLLSLEKEHRFTYFLCDQANNKSKFRKDTSYMCLCSSHSLQGRRAKGCCLSLRGPKGRLRKVYAVGQGDNRWPSESPAESGGRKPLKKSRSEVLNSG